MAAPAEFLEKIKQLNEEEKWQEVIDFLPESVLEEHKDADLYAEAAQAYWLLGNDEQCKNVATKALTLNIKLAKAYIYLGNVYQEEKQYNRASELFNLAIEFDPNSEYSYNVLGDIYSNLRDYKKAFDSYKKAIELNPEDGYSYDGLGDIYFDLKEYEKSFEAYKKAIELNSKDAVPYNGLGNVYSIFKEHKKAIEAYQKAIELDSDFVAPYQNLADEYHEIKKYNKALEIYKKVIELDQTDIYSYWGLGNLYYDLKQYNNALDTYRKAIKLYPTNSDSYNGLGNIYCKLKHYDKAEEAYKKAIELDPSNASAYSNLGLAYHDLKQYEKALEVYNKGIETVPEYNDIYYNRALIFEETEDYYQAKEDYRKYIELTNDEKDIYIQYAKESIIEIDKIINDEDFGEIKELVNNIKEVLRFTEDCITHYTTMTALGFMLLKKSPQRLSEGAYLNDTSEGRELFKYLAFEDDIRNGHDTDAERFAVKPFIGSFVAENKYDDLTLWRMYGKENREEAKGCAITMERALLIEKIKEKLLAGKKDGTTAIDNELQFYRVAYRDKDIAKKPFSIPGKDVKAATLSKFNKDMAELKTKVTAYEADRKDKPADRQKLKELLNEIAYLFKSVEYQYEHEVRLIIKGIGFDKIVDPSVTPPKVYIELVPIAPAIKKITLGPKVERPDEWASALYYTLDKDLPDKKDKAEILISHLPYK